MENLEEIRRQSRIRRRKIALDILREEPDNLKEIKILIRIARTEGNIAEERAYLQQRLTLEPDNPKVIMQLIRIARNKKELHWLRDQMKQMQPEKEKQIKDAIHMAAMDKDTISTAMLIQMQNEFLQKEAGMIPEMGIYQKNNENRTGPKVKRRNATKGKRRRRGDASSKSQEIDL